MDRKVAFVKMPLSPTGRITRSYQQLALLRGRCNPSSRFCIRPKFVVDHYALPDAEGRSLNRVNLEMIDLHLSCDSFKLGFEPEITEFRI
jgi:hypothetical protein